jgi:hypothetical protein
LRNPLTHKIPVLTFESLVVTIHTTMSNVKTCYVLPTDCICVFCMSVGISELRLCPTPHQLIAFLNSVYCAVQTASSSRPTRLVVTRHCPSGFASSKEHAQN